MLLVQRHVVALLLFMPPNLLPSLPPTCTVTSLHPISVTSSSSLPPSPSTSSLHMWRWPLGERQRGQRLPVALTHSGMKSSVYPSSEPHWRHIYTKYCIRLSDLSCLLEYALADDCTTLQPILCLCNWVQSEIVVSPLEPISPLSLASTFGPIADLSVMVSPWAYGNLYGGLNTRNCTLVLFSCFLSCLCGP